MTENRKVTAAAGYAVIATSTLVLAYLIKRRLQHSSAIRSRQDLKGNSYARGSDVITFYGDRCINPNENGGKKIYIVTGATSGLGRQIALLLGKAGGHVILGVRNLLAGKEIVDEILAQGGGGEAECMHLDLSSLANVRSFAKKFISSGKTLDGLVNNAGLYGVAGKSGDGYQMVWQVDCMAPALLTELLLPATSADFRVVNVSSETNRVVSTIGDKCPPESPGSSLLDYALAKACQVLHSRELTLRFRAEARKEGEPFSSPCSRLAFAVEPGLVKTNIMRGSRPLVQWLNYKMLAPIVRSTDEGTATILFCLLAPHDDLGISTAAAGSDVPFYYSNCAPKEPTKCCIDPNEVRAQAALYASIWGGTLVEATGYQ